MNPSAAFFVLVFLLGSLVSFSERLQPIRSDDDRAMRAELAWSILSSGADEQEARQLMKLAQNESGFARDVATCKRRGKDGEVGPWQELPSWGTVAVVCASLEGAARVALLRVRQSIAACRHLPPEDRLAGYTRGRCDSPIGRYLSRVRYTP